MIEGLLTFILIAAVVSALSLQRRERQDQPARRQKAPEDLRSIADAQAKLTTQRPQIRSSEERITFEQWLEAAAGELRRTWPAMSYDQSRREIRGGLEVAGMVFPDPDYDWSLDAAREFARELVQEIGESYGSNC